MPLYRRTPKRGFTSAVNVYTQELKLSLLEGIEGADLISLELLKEKNLVARRTQKVRVIFDKEIKKVKIDSSIYCTKGSQPFVEVVSKDA
jgi:ribosomal protein L15